ncbi:MAG: class I tRNA ligase family protein [Actinomycetota bacterium]
MSPMVPFITEHVWQTLVRTGESGAPESVHLTSFPEAQSTAIDPHLSSSVALSRRLVELGRAARAESKIKIRQPLSRALVAAAGWNEMDLEFANIFKMNSMSSNSTL